MTHPETFNDWSSALRMREVIAKVVREEMQRQRPRPRYGKVYDFNRFTFNALVLFGDDVDPTPVKFPAAVQPTQSVLLHGSSLANVVRVEGVPGNLWITEICSGGVQEDSTRLHNPRLIGGSFLHTQVASFHAIATTPLPGENESWYVGKWNNVDSFASDGLATIDVVVQQLLFCNITKSYRLSVRTNDTNGVWKKLAATTDSGPWSLNDFELEMKTGADSIEFRIRRTGWNPGGFTPGGYDLSVWFYGQEWVKDPTVPPALDASPPITSVMGVTSAEAKGPFYSPAQALPRLTENGLMGGGSVTYNTVFGQLKWTTVFKAIGMGRNYFATDGCFDIPVPVGGVSVPVYSKSGVTSTTTVAGGIWLGDWDALYYVPPWGTVKTGLEANFRIVNFSSNDGFQVPSHWIFVAAKSGDPLYPYVKLGNGQTIGWPIPLTMNTGYAAFGSGWTAPAYRMREGGYVGLEGLVDVNGAKGANSVLATLPAGFRPPSTYGFAVMSSLGASRIDIQAGGNIVVSPAMADGAFFSLDTILFPRV
jgi:hypothetical protein